MYDKTLAVDYRIVNVTSTTSAQILKALIDAAVAGKSAPANALPNTDIIQIAITPSASLELRDVFTGDVLTIAANARLVVPVVNVLDKLSVKNAATVNVELFFGQ